jgi:DNA-binding NarL/FixJ family response regulator
MIGALDVLIADESPALRRVLRLLLERDGGIRVVGDSADLACAVDRCRALRPAVLLADGDLIRRAGETPTGVQDRLPGTGLLVLSLYPEAHPAPEAPGATTVPVLAKDSAPERLAAAVRAVAARRPHDGGEGDAVAADAPAGRS